MKSALPAADWRTDSFISLKTLVIYSSILGGKSGAAVSFQNRKKIKFCVRCLQIFESERTTIQ